MTYSVMGSPIRARMRNDGKTLTLLIHNPCGLGFEPSELPHLIQFGTRGARDPPCAGAARSCVSGALFCLSAEAVLWGSSFCRAGWHACDRKLEDGGFDYTSLSLRVA